MRRGWIGAATAMAVGAIALCATPSGAAPAPPGSDALAQARAAMAKALSSPRLFRVTRTGGPVVSSGALEMCVDAQVFDRLTRGPEAPGVGAPVAVNRKGCTLSFVRRRDGSFHMDDACDKAAGATRTWHNVVEGTVKDMRSSMEMAIEDPRSGDARIVAMDMHMADIGPCPAGLAPGQARTADGRILDPAAARAAPPPSPR